MINLKIILVIVVFGMVFLNSVIGGEVNFSNITCHISAINNSINDFNESNKLITQSNGTMVYNQTDIYISNNSESLTDNIDKSESDNDFKLTTTNKTNNSTKTKNTNSTNNNYLDVKIEGYKITIKTDGEPFGYISPPQNHQSIKNDIPLEFIKIDSNEYVVHPVVLNVPINICSKYGGNKILSKTVFLNCSLNHTSITRTDKPYLITKYENNSLKIKTNGKLHVIYDSINISTNIVEIGYDLYRVYPLILNNTIIIYSKFSNETLNKTIFLNYTKPKEKHYLNISIENYKLKISTNGELTATTMLNKKVDISIKKLDNSEYIIYPLLLNTTIVLYSKFNNETLNKTIYLPYMGITTKNYTDKKTVIYNNLPFNFYINQGKFKKFDIDINDNVFFEINNLSGSRAVNLTIELPFEIPQGMYIYYWENVSGKLTPINYTILKDRKHVVIFLKDGGTDKCKKESGKITGSFKLYIPKFNVKTEFMDGNKTGILHIYDSKGNGLYNLTVKIDKGKFDYLYFVDKDNIPIKSNVNLPYNLIKFKITDIPKGYKVKVKITYPKFSAEDRKIGYHKFNPNTLKWYNIPMRKYRTTIIYTLEDGALGDDDGKTNGVIVDDGGLGQVGFDESNIATVGLKDNSGNKILEHWYKTLVPYGRSSFTISIEDMDSIKLDVYYPNGTNYGTYHSTIGSTRGFTNTWDNFTINTNGIYGWWKFKIYTTCTYPRGDYYRLKVSNKLLSFTNMTIINREKFLVSPFIYMLGYNTNKLCNESYYVKSDGNFKFAIYDGDNLNVSIYYPNGTLYYNNILTGNNIWETISVNSNICGIYKIIITETNNTFNDSIGKIRYSNRNLYRIGATNPIYMTSDEYEIQQNTKNINVYAYNKTVNVGETFNLTIYIKNTENYNLNNSNVSVELPNELECNYTSKIINCISPNETKEINFTIVAYNGGDYTVNISLKNNLTNIINITKIQVGGIILNGTIYEDFGILGVNDSSDVPIPNVNVSLVKDSNGNNKPDANDLWLYNTSTNSTGNYNFTFNGNGIYFVVVNSKTVNTTRGLNNGYTINDIWAEETYQTEWNGTNWAIIQKFGGQNASQSDDWSDGICEHYIVVNTSNYKGESIDFGYSFDVIVNTRDDDADNTTNSRYAQGTLRQFIINANAIQGANYMKFVPMVHPNGQDINGVWWTIKINKTIGALPYITDDYTIIDGTAYYPNGTVRDDNPGDAYSETRVGIGQDAIPDSGDEYTITAIKRVELAIDGNNVDTNVLKVCANNSKVLNISIYGGEFSDWSDDTGAAILVGGQNITIKNTILNAYPNGTFISNSWVAIDSRDPANCSDLKIIHNLLSRNHPILLGRDGELENILIEENIIWSYWTPSIMFGSYSTISGVINHNYICGGNKPRDIDTIGWACIETRSANVFNLIVEDNTIITYDTRNSTAISLGEYTKDVIIRYNLIRNAKGSAIVMSHYKEDNPCAKNIVITKNSIINSGKIAIDFLNDYITLNDGQFNSSQPNYGIDYPVITRAYFDGTHLHIRGFIGNETQGSSSGFAYATVEIYLVTNLIGGDNLMGNDISSDGSVLSNYYGEGWIYLGALTADKSGNFEGIIDVSGKMIKNGALVTATATLPNIGTSEFGPDYEILRYCNLKASIELTNEGYNVSLILYNNTQNVYVYWDKPNGINVINISGDYNENGIYGNIYWFKFNAININETKNIIIKTNISTVEGLIIGINPN